MSIINTQVQVLNYLFLDILKCQKDKKKENHTYIYMYVNTVWVNQYTWLSHSIFNTGMIVDPMAKLILWLWWSTQFKVTGH